MKPSRGTQFMTLLAQRLTQQLFSIPKHLFCFRNIVSTLETQKRHPYTGNVNGETSGDSGWLTLPKPAKILTRAAKKMSSRKRCPSAIVSWPGLKNKVADRKARKPICRVREHRLNHPRCCSLISRTMQALRACRQFIPYLR